MTERAPLNYADQTLQPLGKPRLARTLGVAACIIGLVATSVPMGELKDLYRLPDGTVIMPVSLFVSMVMTQMTGVFLCLPLTAACLKFGWRTPSIRWLALLALLASLAAIFLNGILFDWIVAVRHLRVSE